MNRLTKISARPAGAELQTTVPVSPLTNGSPRCSGRSIATAMKPAFLLLVLVAAIAGSPLLAESRTATMNVSVTVIGRAIVTASDQPDIVVTQEDLNRGYVEVAVPYVLTVRTNSRRGYILRVVNTEPAFRSAQLTAGNLTMNVSSESIIARPYQPGADSLVLNVRLILNPAAQAGRYAFPIAVDATPMS